MDQTLGELPETLHGAFSPTGSMHYFSSSGRRATTSAIRSARLRAGVDVKGDGGFVVAPPTYRPDVGFYEWLNGNEIADAPPAWIAAVCAARNKPKAGKKKASTQLPVNRAEIEAALKVIPADEYETWFKVLSALRNGLGDDGKELGRWWSATSDKFDEAEYEQKWADVVDVKEIGIGTIYHLADQSSPGWRLTFTYNRKPEEKARRDKQIAEINKIGNEIPPESLLPTIMSVEEMVERLVLIGKNSAVVDRVTGRLRNKEPAVVEYAASVVGVRKEGFCVEGVARFASAPERRRCELGAGRAANFPASRVRRRRGDVVQPVARAAAVGSAGRTGRRAPRHSWTTSASWSRSRPSASGSSTGSPTSFSARRSPTAHSYLMTTPMTGIGRNWLSSVLVRVLRGHVAAGVSLPELLNGGFTGRLSQKLLAVVDEAKEGQRRQAVAEGGPAQAADHGGAPAHQPQVRPAGGREELLPVADVQPHRRAAVRQHGPAHRRDPEPDGAEGPRVLCKDLRAT